jgi:hypothetical protein
VQLLGLLQACHAVHPRQLQIGGNQRHIHAVARQPLQYRQSCRWRVSGHNAVVRSEAANQRSLGRYTRLPISVYND